MNRSRFLLWMSWFGACCIGGLSGSQMLTQRSHIPAYLALYVFGYTWILVCSELIKRLISPVIGRASFQLSLFALAIPLVSITTVSLFADEFAKRPTLLLWAIVVGAILGLASGLLSRFSATSLAQRYWLLANIGCGAIALPTAMLALHAFAPNTLAAGAIISAGWGIIPGVLFTFLPQTISPRYEQTIKQQLARVIGVRQRWIGRVLIVVSLIGFGIGFYRVRCDVITCAPATWAEILDITQSEAAKLGPDYQVTEIHAEPDFRSPLTSEGPLYIEVRAELTSPKREIPGSGRYFSQAIKFDDRALLIHRGESYGSMPALPDAQQRLEYIQLGPRDVYRITWQLAQQELSSTIRLSQASMSLYLNDTARHRTESVWFVSYYDAVDNLTYIIDAQSGEILKVDKYRFGDSAD